MFFIWTKLCNIVHMYSFFPSKLQSLEQKHIFPDGLDPARFRCQSSLAGLSELWCRQTAEGKRTGRKRVSTNKKSGKNTDKPGVVFIDHQLGFLLIFFLHLSFKHDQHCPHMGSCCYCMMIVSEWKLKVFGILKIHTDKNGVFKHIFWWYLKIIKPKTEYFSSNSWEWKAD